MTTCDNERLGQECSPVTVLQYCSTLTVVPRVLRSRGNDTSILDSPQAKWDSTCVADTYPKPTYSS